MDVRIGGAHECFWMEILLLESATIVEAEVPYVVAEVMSDAEAKSIQDGRTVDIGTRVLAWPKKVGGGYE